MVRAKGEILQLTMEVEVKIRLQLLVQLLKIKKKAHLPSISRVNHPLKVNLPRQFKLQIILIVPLL